MRVGCGWEWKGYDWRLVGRAWQIMERNAQLGLEYWKRLERQGVSIDERERRTAPYWTEDTVVLKRVL